MGVWSVVGGVAGAALAFGLASHTRKHWAVRALSGVLFLLAFAGLIVAGLVSGKDSAAWDVAGPMFAAFVLLSGVSGLCWIWRGAVVASKKLMGSSKKLDGSGSRGSA